MIVTLKLYSGFCDDGMKAICDGDDIDAGDMRVIGVSNVDGDDEYAQCESLIAVMMIIQRDDI